MVFFFFFFCFLFVFVVFFLDRRENKTTDLTLLHLEGPKLHSFGHYEIDRVKPAVHDYCTRICVYVENYKRRI